MSPTIRLRATGSLGLTGTADRQIITTSDVPLTLLREEPGTGSTFCSTGVPLAPGDLIDVGAASLWIGNVMVPSSLTPVGKPHDDGSVRVVMVQHTRDMTQGVPVVAELRLGVPQALPVTFVEPTFTTMSSSGWQSLTPVPGLVISRDAARICASGVLGRLAPRPSPVPSTPSWMATLEERWDTIHDAKWAQYDGISSERSYGQYDPIFNQAQRWGRKGSVAEFVKAVRVYGRRRTSWLTASPVGGIPYYVVHQEGLAAMATLLGDTVIRNNHRSYCTSNLTTSTGSPWNSAVSGDGTDGRSFSSYVWHLIACDRMGDGLVVSRGFTIREWIRRWALERVMAATQWRLTGVETGAFMSRVDPPGSPAGSGTPPWSNNFMAGMLASMLAEVHDVYLTDVDEKAAVKQRILDCMSYIWNTQMYLDADPSPATTLANRVVSNYQGVHPTPTRDITAMYIGGLAWLAENVNRATWQPRLDIVLEVMTRPYGLASPYFNPEDTASGTGKVANDNFIYMGRALARRVD